MTARFGEAERSRRLEFVALRNFRDLGGYPTTGGSLTRWGWVFRSDSLHYLTVDEIDRFDALGLEVIFDLRRLEEIEERRGRGRGGMSNFPADA